MLGEDVVKLILEIRKLIDHSHSMEMATHYKKFNYGFIDRLIQKIVEKQASEDELKELYPKCINQRGDSNGRDI